MQWWRGEGSALGSRFLRATLVANAMAATATWAMPIATGTDPYPAPLVDASGVSAPGFGSITFVARDGNTLQAITYRGTRFDPLAGRIWFVMHGAGRTAQSYAEAAAPVAERYDALAIAIRFPEELYPNQTDYTLGVGVDGTLNTEVYDASQWRAPHDYLYSEIEHVFEAVRTTLGGSQAGYFLFGHSAGAQFVHRLVTFRPDARLLGAVAANAGWYTRPSRGGGNDPNYFMPYGLQGTPVVDADVRDILRKPLTILLGSRDTASRSEDPLLRDTLEARAQGRTRLTRGMSYFANAVAEAKAVGVSLRWRKRLVPGAGHDKDDVMPSAGFVLFDALSEPCESSTAAEAAALVISEIHADPASGAAGDANADGRREANEDEFVELVNTGATPLCLSGWTLGDVTDSARHLFPLGRTLPAGAAIVIFGGGQPTGDFGGANVQWAASGGRLNLSNAGDVLTLRDAAGGVALQVSWGDCDGAPCATDHIPGHLDIAGSVVRWPEPLGTWTVHADITSTLWSPGTRANGDAW